MGSFDPLSTSSRAVSRSFTRMPCARKTANTAAASVDDTMLASRKATIHGRSRTAIAARATMAAVSSTPTDASVRAGAMTARNCTMSVRRPPSKRMRASATVPTPWASS